jgi:hypothetical protein
MRKPMPPSKDATKPAKSKPITIKLDRMLGLALRQYKKDTKLAPAEVVYRALLYYWLAKKTSAAEHAVNTAELKTDEAWAAFLAPDDEEANHDKA